MTNGNSIIIPKQYQNKSQDIRLRECKGHHAYSIFAAGKELISFKYTLIDIKFAKECDFVIGVESDPE